MKESWAWVMLAVLLMLILVSTGSAFGQELAVVHYGIREGLPSAYVSCLAQGSDGRIWIGHSAGVSVYDGRSFENLGVEDGLLGQNPSGITAGTNGEVWVSFPQKGIQSISREGMVANVPDPDGLLVRDHVAFLYTLDGGRQVVAAGDRGYYFIDPTGVDGPHYPIAGSSGAVTMVLDLAEDGGLFATEDGVFRIDEEGSEPVPVTGSDLWAYPVSVMASGPDHALWFLGPDGELARCQSGSDCVSWTVSDSREPFYPYRIAVDREGVVWIASSSGLQRFKDGELEVLAEDAGLSNSFAVDLLVDRDQVLWVATESGLDKISRRGFRNFRWQKNFPVNSVWSIEELSDGTVWLGTNAGIVTVDRDWKTRVLTRADGLPEKSIVDIKSTPWGDVWVLGYSGVYRWDGRRFQDFPQADLETLNLYEVLPLEEEIWICTSYGVYRLEPRTNTLAPHPLNSELSGSKIITRAIAAGEGRVWLLGPKLYLWDRRKGLQEIVFPADWKVSSVRNVVETGEGLLVLTDRGLAQRTGSGWARFSSAGKQLFDLVRGGDGTIWLGCNDGLSRFDGESFEFFGFYDGVALGECNTGAALLDSRGVVWLGGVNVTLVFPSLLRSPPAAVPEIIEVAAQGRSLRFPERVDFPPGLRNVTIRFAAPSFWNEQGQLYRYRLDGFDSDWSEPSNEGFARYSSIPPGEFKFDVQCRPSNGIWSDARLPLTVNVAPAWWQTPYARIAFVLALISCGALVGTFRIRVLKSRQVMLERLVEQQTVEIRSQRDAMARLATTDDLTGLPNRRKCSELMEREMARAGRTGSPFSVFLFDVDHFKAINDQNGHEAGDRVLEQIAASGQSVVRATDTLGRWGGDEFILLMPDTDSDSGREVSLRLKAAVEAAGVPWKTGRVIRVTISGGISTSLGDEDGGRPSISWMVRDADEALYRAKEEGRSRIA